MDNHIIHNSIKTPDGTILVSNHVHDYRTHKDKNGLEYMVDGGKEYLRRTLHKEPYEELSVYSDDPHSEVRKVFTWGSFGIKGGQHLKMNTLEELSTDHIHNIIENITYIPSWFMDIFKRELVYRTELKSGGGYT